MSCRCCCRYGMEIFVPTGMNRLRRKECEQKFLKINFFLLAKPGVEQERRRKHFSADLTMIDKGSQRFKLSIYSSSSLSSSSPYH
jgi:hypothetical protein